MLLFKLLSRAGLQTRKGSPLKWERDVINRLKLGKEIDIRLYHEYIALLRVAS